MQWGRRMTRRNLRIFVVHDASAAISLGPALARSTGKIETMVRLTPAQRRLLVAHIPPLANLAAGSLLFGQIPQRPSLFTSGHADVSTTGEPAPLAGSGKLISKARIGNRFTGWQNPVR